MSGRGACLTSTQEFRAITVPPGLGFVLSFHSFDIKRRVQSSSINLQTGDLVSTAPKFCNALNARKKEIARLPMSNKKRINAITRIRDRPSSAKAPGVKAPGSNTFKNVYDIGNW